MSKENLLKAITIAAINGYITYEICSFYVCLKKTHMWFSWLVVIFQPIFEFLIDVEIEKILSQWLSIILGAAIINWLFISTVVFSYRHIQRFGINSN